MTKKIKYANKKFKSSLIEISDSINKKNRTKNNFKTNSNNNYNNIAVLKILKFFNIDAESIPNNLKTANQKLEFLLKTHIIISRKIELSNNWHKTLINPIIVKTINHKPVAIVPSKSLGCFYFDNETQKKVRINNKNKNFFETEATIYFKPLPPKQISFIDLIKYSKELISWFDCFILILVSLATTLLGLLVPKMVKLIFSTIVELKNIKFLSFAGLFLIITTFSEHLLNSLKNLLCHKIVRKISTQIESAIVIRVFNLPNSFFKKFNSGNISTKINALTNFLENLLTNSLHTWLKCTFSIAYFIQIFSYSKELVIPSVLIVATTIVFCVFAAINRSKFGFKRLNLLAEENSTCLEIINGIEKIKLVGEGSEKLIFARWAQKFANISKITYNPPWQLKINNIVLSAINAIGNIFLCIVAALSKIKPANFFAFNIAYSTIENTFSSLVTTILEFAKIKPISKMMDPIFKTYSENKTHKKTINHLTGSITINELNFSYDDDFKPILEKISLKIKPFETVAFVGKTGCGKSTLIRLLMGFEIPSNGSIFFDDNNLAAADLQSLRKKIGIVLQNGKLFNGNIFLNIAASSKHMSLKKAWHAAKLAQIANDIEQMPLKMNTLVTREGGEFSSSQIQRILIARALACDPKILIFDDATSALDENLQNKILKAIKTLNCTKIIIAHRISTIKCCDRIFVLKNSKIVEEGSFEQLMKNKNEFYNLAKH